MTTTTANDTIATDKIPELLIKEREETAKKIKKIQDECHEQLMKKNEAEAKITELEKQVINRTELYKTTCDYLFSAIVGLCFCATFAIVLMTIISDTKRDYSSLELKHNSTLEYVKNLELEHEQLKMKYNRLTISPPTKNVLITKISSDDDFKRFILDFITDSVLFICITIPFQIIMHIGFIGTFASILGISTLLVCLDIRNYYLKKEKSAKEYGEQEKLKKKQKEKQSEEKPNKQKKNEWNNEDNIFMR